MKLLELQFDKKLETEEKLYHFKEYLENTETLKNILKILKHLF